MKKPGAGTPSLRDHHTTLRSILFNLRSGITGRLETQRKRIESRRSVIKDVESKIQALKDDIDAANSRTTYLDTTDLEEQKDFDGQATFLHIRKSIGITPNFQYNLKTKFPIRKYETDLDRYSKWKSVTCELGGYSFQGEVKTKPFQDGRAQVALYTWKKDIHAVEIEAVKKCIVEAQEQVAACISQVDKLNSDCERLRVRQETTLKQLNESNLDIGIMSSIQLEPSKDDPIQAYVEADSISGIAEYYNLRSKFYKKNDGQPATWLSRSYGTYHASVVAYLDRAKAEYLALVTRITPSDLTAHEDLLDMTKGPEITSAELSVRQTMQDSNLDIEVQALCNEALGDLQDLKAPLASIPTLLLGEVSSNNSQTMAEPGESAVTVEQKLGQCINMLKRDLKAQDEATRLIEADIRAVGVEAALRSMSATSDAWLSVYRGIKIKKEIRHIP